MSAELPPDQKRIDAWLERITGRAGPFPLALIPGGASPRRFYRTEAFGRRVIVMLVPPDTGDVAFARERGRGWPFLEVRELLERAGVRVPALLAASVADELLLVEDLGATLATHLERVPDDREALYRLAVTDLARAQPALADLPADSVVRLRAFDAALFGAELDHFWDWAIAARDVAAPHAPFQRARDYLLNELTALPRGFTHRDYQSRNLVVTPGPERGAGETPHALGWIDFQDALLGPRAYDLVALLCDSYQPFDRGFVEARLDDYATARHLGPSERRALGREFDLLTLQRKLKDAGRFVFIEKKRGDASFLPFVRPTLDIVLNALDRVADVPELGALRPVVVAARTASTTR
ncbi:MAG TPA: phosphotransferase [Polyangiaceae bacterium]|nr:phosphotransferase [Polyangiaceae bacterium]